MQANSPSPSKARQVAGNILIYLGGLMIFAGGCLKFAHVPKVVAEMTSLGFGGDKLTLVASLEVLAALLFVLRPLRSIGLLFVSSFLGGAICAHIQHGPYSAAVPPAMVLGFCWWGVFLRYPQAFWSIESSQLSTGQMATPEPGTERRIVGRPRAAADHAR